MDEKLKHLEFVQAIITRMAQNSFLIKGWTITLVSALFALSAKDSNPKFVYVAYFPLIIFGVLDSYYLYQERLFRKVYDHIRVQPIIDFSLSTAPFDSDLTDWAKAAVSMTIILFYGAILCAVIILSFYIKHHSCTCCYS